MSKVIHPKYSGAEWVIYENSINSSAKQKYSFPKSDRFRSTVRPLNERVSYDLPSTLIGRATSFGYGERSPGSSRRGKQSLIRIMSALESPSPDKYEVKVGFDSLMSTRRNIDKTFCFATGREQYEKVFMPGKSNFPDPIVPGPGTYNFQREIGHDRLKFSIKSRLLTGDPSEIEKKKGVPGPGWYPNTL